MCEQFISLLRLIPILVNGMKYSEIDIILLKVGPPPPPPLSLSFSSVSLSFLSLLPPPSFSRPPLPPRIPLPGGVTTAFRAVMRRTVSDPAIQLPLPFASICNSAPGR